MLINGTTSIPVSGSPDFFGGKYFFCPFTSRGGDHMVTWPDLIAFCTFLVVLISLILGIVDHNNKK